MYFQRHVFDVFTAKSELLVIIIHPEGGSVNSDYMLFGLSENSNFCITM